MRKPRNQEVTRNGLSWLPGFLIVLAVLGVLAVNSYAQPATARPGPKLLLSADAWDFAQVNQGPTLTKEIRVENAGDEPLEITAVESSCPTCVTGRAESKTLPPTGRTKLVLKFFSANVEGKQAKHLTLRTNDPAQPEKKIAVAGVVSKGPKPKIKVEPETWDVGLVAEGDVRHGRLMVRNEGDAALRITGLTPSEGIGVDAPEPSDDLAPGQTATVKTDFLAERGKRGLVKAYVHVESNDPVHPTKVVQVTGYVHGGAPDGSRFRVQGSGTVRTDATGVVVIEPVLGEALAPGTGKAAVKSLRVTNGLPDTAVTLRIGFGKGDEEARGEAGARTVGPKESADIPIALPSLDADATLTIRIHLPALQPKPPPAQ